MNRQSLFWLLSFLFVLSGGAAARNAAVGGEGKPLFRDCSANVKLQPGGSAACWVDINRDGWTDLCTDSVWLNHEGKVFERLVDSVGAVVAGDYDNDGYVDLFSWSSLKLLHNRAGKTFEPAPLPRLPACVSRGACWADLNNDGFVDLYVGGYEDWNKGITYPDLVLMNDRARRFELAWSEVRYRARGVTACDYDEDGDVDIYVSNYRLQPNVLWINDGTGRLTDAAKQRHALATSGGFPGGHSIGAAWGDFDNDGLFDLFAGNFAHVDTRGDQPKSRFLRNLGPDGSWAFDDKGPCGVHYQESYASPSAADFDNDGDLDLYFTTVYAVASFGRRNYPVLYRNDGNFRFHDVTAAAGLDKLPPTYQGAWADFDNDGDLDLVTPGRLFENRHGGGHWLEVRLEADVPWINRSAIGTRVRVSLPDRTLARQIESGTGEGNQNDHVLHFGLGSRDAAVDLSITWPDGRQQVVKRVTPDQRITVHAEH